MKTLKEVNQKAHDELSRLCKNPKSFTMRVPADRERDSDLIISDALCNADKMIELIVWLSDECSHGTMTYDLSHDFADSLRNRLDLILSGEEKKENEKAD